MKKVIINQDMVTGVLSGVALGVAVPAALEGIAIPRLRFDGNIIVDISALGTFFIDDGGLKHLIQHDAAWPAVNCSWDDQLVDVDGNWVVQDSAVKSAKRSEIRRAYQQALLMPVTVADVKYHGGYESASKLDAAKRLAEMATVSDVTFYDVDNVGHLLPCFDADPAVIDAQAIILAIGLQVQTLFAKKQELMVAIDHAADQAALDLIDW